MAEDHDKDRGRGGSGFRPESTFKEPSPEGTASSARLPSLSAPKGGGATRSIGEKFSANVATGTASLSVPIARSPGRGGFNLGLELRYDLGARIGPFGVVGQVSVPSITRKKDKGIPRYIDDAESDVFILSGAKGLIPVPCERRRGEFCVVRSRSRIEQGFARVDRWTHQGTVPCPLANNHGDNVTNTPPLREEA